MRELPLFLLLVGINLLILIGQIQGLSIGYHEAKILYGEFSPLQQIITLSLHLFGQNDYALRAPMIVLHLFSVFLLYAISKFYVSGKNDRIWIVLIYMLLPGVTSAALIVDNAGLMIALVFLFAYGYLRFGRYALALFPLYIGIDPAFAYLFFATAIYGLYRKEWWYGFVGGASFIVSLYVYGIHVGGLPESRFLDAFGIYAAIFSPIVFLYLFYVLYRRMIAKQWDLIWMIAMSAFVISILLSFRQKVEVQTFAPYLMLALPMAGETFLHTYRIRLREFRGKYRLLFYSAFILLIINASVVFFNQWFYRFLKDPTRHFSYSMHIVKELAGALKENHIYCVDANDKKLQLRLRFYGVTQCKMYHLTKKRNPKALKVTISYKNTPIFHAYVTKINK
ncbi:hypothetical protein [Sulfuricurvum sp.]|uniref:hypothetical protein n=1 Tax=Sulfuricurvum sp. TaxID=2025608 RepID=UPI0026369EF2|nr:hypothetical protein [Sulfuricurvum sp.]MDD3596605.1 hypothetical protein [Sulfuricurvum sp.]MDD4884460.1 hypothetical protein [Sulfuricurvum sp.]